jgi:energy-coupling factor transporter ATP-binding protein EcfA2
MKQKTKTPEALKQFEFRTPDDLVRATVALNRAGREIRQNVVITGPRGSGKSELRGILASVAGLDPAFLPVHSMPPKYKFNGFVWDFVRGAKVVCLSAPSYHRPPSGLVVLLAHSEVTIRIPRTQHAERVPLTRTSFYLESEDDKVAPDIAARAVCIRLGRTAVADGNREVGSAQGEVRPVYSSEFVAELQHFLTEDFQLMQIEARAIPRTGSGTLTQRHKLAAAMDYNVTVSNWIDREWIKRTATATSGGKSVLGIRLRVGDLVKFRRMGKTTYEQGTIVATKGMNRRRRLVLSNGVEGDAENFTLVARAGKGGAS